jgi:hypothetical protein
MPTIRGGGGGNGIDGGRRTVPDKDTDLRRHRQLRQQRHDPREPQASGKEAAATDADDNNGATKTVAPIQQ